MSVEEVEGGVEEAEVLRRGEVVHTPQFPVGGVWQGLDQWVGRPGEVAVAEGNQDGDRHASQDLGGEDPPVGSGHEGCLRLPFGAACSGAVHFKAGRAMKEMVQRAIEAEAAATTDGARETGSVGAPAPTPDSGMAPSSEAALEL